MTNKGENPENQIGYCETIQDLKNSPITSEIIDITSKNCGSIVDIKGEVHLKNNNFDFIQINTYGYSKEIYTKFISNKPITPNEQQLILGFLNDQKALKMTQNIFSKLKIPQGNDNKFLFDIYLKDAKGDFDITNFVEYLKHYIQNYSLITRNDISDLSYQQTINEIEYYTYKCADGTNSIFVITEGKIVYLDKPLSKIQVLNNGLVFGIEPKDPTLNQEDPYILTLFSDHKELTKGVLYEFNGKEFIQIYNKPGLDGLSKYVGVFDGFNDLFLSTSNWKEGLIEISSNEKKSESGQDTEINEILPAVNNRVIVHRNGFITTTNIEQIEVKRGEEKQYRHTTYAKTDTYQGPPELPTMPVGQRETLDETSLLNLKNKYKGPLSLKPVMPICEILSSDKKFELRSLGDDFFMTVMEDGSNIYKFNETNLSFREIEGLKGIHTDKYMGHKSTDLNEDKLLNGEPTIIDYTNNTTQIAVFDKNSRILNDLILLKNYYYSHDLKKDRIRIKINQLDKDFIFYYYKDGKLYGFKKGFKCTSRGTLEKNFLGFSTKVIEIEDTYEEMKEYLEEIKGPVVID